jgi:chromosome segregation ATPase
LADAAARTIALEAERQHDLARVEAARAEAENARTASKSLQMSLDQLRDDHKRELEKERRLREEACQQVKKEMIAAAEEQFGKANELYVKLKHEYDSTMMKAGRIERELKSCKRELDSCRQEQAAREVEIRAELAQLKAGEFYKVASITLNAFLFSLTQWSRIILISTGYRRG